MGERDTWEDGFGPVERRIRRVWRGVRWHGKGLFGLRRRVLVEIRWRLGDEIMALPLYGALAARHPNTEIHVRCTYPELLPKGVTPAGDDFDPDRYVYLRDDARDRNRIEHYARLAGVTVPTERPRVAASASLASDWQAPAGSRVAIAPGATWPTKRWSTERWRALAETLTGDGYDVVVLGNAGEGIGAGRDRTGQTLVTDCARILSGADICVSSDSGLMHLALAVGTPVVALFGPTNPAILVRDDPRLHAVTNERECRYCWNDSREMIEPGVCPRQIADCLGTIDVDTVLREVRIVLETR